MSDMQSSVPFCTMSSAATASKIHTLGVYVQKRVCVCAKSQAVTNRVLGTCKVSDKLRGVYRTLTIPSEVIGCELR